MIELPVIDVYNDGRELELVCIYHGKVLHSEKVKGEITPNLLSLFFSKCAEKVKEIDK